MCGVRWCWNWAISDAHAPPRDGCISEVERLGRGKTQQASAHAAECEYESALHLLPRPLFAK